LGRNKPARFGFVIPAERSESRNPVITAGGYWIPRLAAARRPGNDEA
jgi:hypothetical protein